MVDFSTTPYVLPVTQNALNENFLTVPFETLNVLILHNIVNIKNITYNVIIESGCIMGRGIMEDWLLYGFCLLLTLGASFYLCKVAFPIEAELKKRSNESGEDRKVHVRIEKTRIDSKKKNGCLLVAFVISIAYIAYILNHFFSGYSGSMGETVATALVLPHIMMAIGATVLNIIAYVKNTKGWALFSAILYSVSALLFMLYVMFLIPSIILTFVGWYQLKTKELELADEEDE